MGKNQDPFSHPLVERIAEKYKPRTSLVVRVSKPVETRSHWMALAVVSFTLAVMTIFLGSF